MRTIAEVHNVIPFDHFTDVRGIFDHLPYFSLNFDDLPQDHHMSVTQGVEIIKLQRKVWQIVKYPDVCTGPTSVLISKFLLH
jgi:hypothetical protein